MIQHTRLHIGMDPTDQEGIDKKMNEVIHCHICLYLQITYIPLHTQSHGNAITQVDGTPNKTNIGANAILAVSMAVSKAGAAARGTHTRTEIESVPARERDRERETERESVCVCVLSSRPALQCIVSNNNDTHFPLQREAASCAVGWVNAGAILLNVTRAHACMYRCLSMYI